MNFFVLVPVVLGQGMEVRIEPGETDLVKGQPFELKVFIRNAQERSDIVFPAITGLEKGSTTRLRSSVQSGERSAPQEVVIQQYFLSGSLLEIPPSEVIVEGRVYAVPALTLRLLEDTRDTSSVSEREHLELGDVLPGDLEREDVFLALRVNKRRVYLREGFAAYLSLYVARDVSLSMEFHDLSRQLTEISKQLKLDGCWEENTWIAEIVPRAVTVNEREYTEYRLYQSVFFPFILKNIRFPSVGLKMEMGEGEGNLRTFNSKPVVVEVRNLPAHPRRDAVAVGRYELVENLSAYQTVVGQPFRYRFGISGEGNIAAIPAPVTIPVQTFEFYPPEINQSIKADVRTVSGTKTFDYTLVAKQKGTYPLKGYFQWIYFDPVREEYDTLRSAKTLTVVGNTGAVVESVVPIGENRLYANLEQLDSTTVHRNYSGIFRIVMNVVVILMLGLMLWVFRK